ncbi:MAG: enoyl-CoA hydratase/isomerase family protein [Pseudomonadales bacterium]|nr:enoyl-CoA hydratase/isomerase family protein [Pseudomonadales bacterium]
MSEELEVSLSAEGVLNITMNRPQVHNAFDDKQIARFIAALDEAGANPSVRVVVIAGHGRSFSAGGDINYMRRMGSNTYQENLADGGQLARLMKTLNSLPKPTIARVQGAAMGGGVGLVSCCDFAIGTPSTRLALSEVKLGMVPATISPYVVMTIGEKAARRLFMSGQPVLGEEACRLGFLSAVVEEDQLDTAVTALAQNLLKNAPAAVGRSKQLAMDVAASAINDDLIAATIKVIADVRDSDEGREGLSAFLEKRAPAWQQD